ncbi:hypothetical protein GBAR_LOCUS17470, partial [Geodia barretti]
MLASDLTVTFSITNDNAVVDDYTLT